MKNERILIFGDSYSTFEGYVPEGYHLYYPRETHPSVDDVSKTWWKMLASETESEIVLNNSWSGSTICNTGYEGDCSTTSSFIFRLGQLIENGFFEKNQIDRVFVFGGTNDCWTGNSLGEIKYDDWTKEDLGLVLPGYSYFMDKLLSVMPKEKIFVIINNELKEDVTNGFLEILRHYELSHLLISNIDKVEGHPTYQGMCEIKNQVLANL